MPKNRISKGKDGRYRYAVTDASGQRFNLASRRSETKRDFSVRCDALDKQADGDVRADTLNDLFEEWIELQIRPSRSPGLERIYTNIYNNFIRHTLGFRKVSEIKRADVFRILANADSKGYSASYIKKIRLCISAPYNFAINSLGYALTSPTSGLRFDVTRKIERKSRIISPDDLERVLEATRASKYHRYFRILSITGLRPSEALGLQIVDITETHLQIRRGVTIDGHSDLKTAAAKRDIPLFPQLRSLLLEQKAESVFLSKEGWLFPSESGSPSMNAVMNAFKRILRQTEEWHTGGRNGMKKLRLMRPSVKASLYDFRHTFATRMAESGMDSLTLKTLMGHEDISVTMKYYIEYTAKMEQEAIRLLESNY